MLKEIEERLTSLAAALRERELLQQRADGLAARLAAADAELVELRERYAGEQRDVDRLTGLSLTRILVALRGAREDALARERAEADAARYRVAAAEARRDAVRAELGLVEQRLAATTRVPVDYGSVLAEKEEFLLRTGTGHAGRLLELADARGRIKAELRELDEARVAAARTAEALAAVREELSRAAGWSTYDTFFGGGVIASSMKHSRLDDAAAKAEYADRCLAVLRAELADVGVPAPLSEKMRISGLTRFADIWFDNIFTDLGVRDQIKSALDQVEWAGKRVAGVQDRLGRRTETAREHLRQNAHSRRALLEF